MARIPKAAGRAAATRADVRRAFASRDPADKINWPTLSVRIDPAVLESLDRELLRLKLTRSTWAREVLTRAAAKLVKTKGGN